MKLIASDYLLLLLYLNDKSPIKGSLRITKMMFLFEKQIVPSLKNIDTESLPDFVSYNFGPFSKELYQQLELFKGIGFVEIDEKEFENGMVDVDNVVESEFIDECFEDENEEKQYYTYKIYNITDIGCGYVENKILGEVNEEQMKLLEKFKKKITDISINQLLYYVYSKYPEYTDKSLIKDEVLKNGH